MVTLYVDSIEIVADDVQFTYLLTYLLVMK